MKGIIIAATGNKYVVYSKGITYNVFPKGILKYKNKNLYVGDEVEFNDDTFTIDVQYDRRNELIRPRSANIDQVFVVMSVLEPELSPELLYKFLTYVNMNGLVAKVVFTKIDLLKSLDQVNELKKELEKLGIEVFLVSKKDPESVKKLKEEFKNKISIFMGQTGVGKSSLINEIDPAFERKIGDYSLTLGRGKHQTKEVILLPYEGGFLGDTPGFSSLDLGVYKEDLAQFFPGYNAYYTECFYSNCLHQNEKNCMIKAKIESGELSSLGYKIYLKLLNELPYRKERYK